MANYLSAGSRNIILTVRIALLLISNQLIVLIQNLTPTLGAPKETYEGPRSLEENLRADYEFLGGDMTDEELKLLTALLRDLLVLEPGKRKSASEIVDYPWLCGS